MKVDVYATAYELAEIIKDDKSLVEKDLTKQGSQLLGLFQDGNFKDSFQNLREMKVKLFRMAIEDLSMGALTLRSSTLGLTLKDGKIQTYVAPFGNAPSGNVLYSINLKDVAAFKNWRKEKSPQEDDISQEDLNAAIYRLTVALAEVV